MNILRAMDLLFLVLIGWQQQVDYAIQACLCTDSHTLTATEQVRYLNASPEIIDTLFFHLYANAYQDVNTVYAREAAIMGDDRFVRSAEHERGQIDVTGVLLDNQAILFTTESTLLIIPLPVSLIPGDSIVLTIEFTLVFPSFFSRLGYADEHYEAVQWYPKVCVFDQDGWHLDTYHALGEFYGEFATYDVRIDLPGSHIVAATGERANPDDRAFMDALAENKTSLPAPERREVHFCAAAVHDFAWVCDPDYRVKHYQEEGVSLYVFYLKQHENKWRNAGDYARDAIRRYTMWYGPYPYNSLSIAESHVRGGMEYPMIVLVGSGEDTFTRLFEVTLIHELAHQWFYGVLGNSELEEAWLDEGFAAYSEMRYLEDKYEDDGWLFKVPFPVRPSRRYFHQLVYYIIQTNGMESPVRTPAYRFVNAPIAYENSAYSKPALFLQYLDDRLGHDTFAAILKRYCQDYRFKHVRSEDFIAVCEKESGQELEWLFDPFLNTTQYCDWCVRGVEGRYISIGNNGEVNMPVDILVETDQGPWVYALGANDSAVTINVPASMGDIKSVTIDPSGYAIEPDRWNNHYPRKVVVRPFFGLPTFDAYQIFLLPYLWYGSYDGIKIGLYVLGSEFADYDFIKGRHQWLVGGNYGTKSEFFYPIYSYQTPLVFDRGRRIRVFLQGSNSRDRDNVTLGIRSTFGVPFSPGGQNVHESAVVYQEMMAYLATDSADWELGRSVMFRNTLGIERNRWSARFGISFAHRLFGSDWNFLKVTGEGTYRSRIPVPFSVRLFLGYVAGTAARQDLLYLSGSLRITPLADIIFDQSGYWSPQEHIHIPGDGSMRGYQTLHIKTDRMITVNLELPTHLPIRVFTDAGYYEKFAFDIGCRLVLGPVSLNVPFYTLTDADWELRWSIGLP